MTITLSYQCGEQEVITGQQVELDNLEGLWIRVEQPTGWYGIRLDGDSEPGYEVVHVSFCP